MVGGVVGEGTSDGGGQVAGDVVLTGDGHTGHALGQPIQIGRRRSLTVLPALGVEGDPGDMDPGLQQPPQLPGYRGTLIGGVAGPGIGDDEDGAHALGGGQTQMIHP